MPLAQLMDWLKHKPARPHEVVEQFDAAPPNDARSDALQAGIASGYFRIRLREMALADDRRLGNVIAPAAMLIVEHGYGGARLRRPLFLSNRLLEALPAGMDGSKIRIRFENMEVIGPTPYDGADVDLFVGLFQMTLQDRRRMLFGTLEKLVGAFDIGVLSKSIKLVDDLSGDLVRALGGDDIDCLLANDAVLNPAGSLRGGTVAYLRSPTRKVQASEYRIEDGRLRKLEAGKSVDVDDVDYCVIGIERFETRSDILAMSFNTVFSTAMQIAREDRPQDARAAMLQCARDIAASAELTEDHKVVLIDYYQARLAGAIRRASTHAGSEAANRGASDSIVRTYQARAISSAPAVDEAFLKKQFDEMALVESAVLGSGEYEHELTVSMIDAQLARAKGRRNAPGSAARLANALFVGAMAH